MKIQKCKGTHDLSPVEMTAFRSIEETFRKSCESWGYKEVRTPTIEYLHLFTSAGTLTPSMLGRVYSFLDWDGWSGERVVLRPDGTIPVARLYIESIKSGLAKLYYVTNIFVFEETGKKSRERWQCGAELIGAGSSLADTELISLSLEVLTKLGLKDIDLRLSHAGLIKSLLAKLEVSPQEQTNIFDQILDGNFEALSRVKTPAGIEDTLLPLLDLKGQSSGFLKNMKALCSRNLPEICNELDDFIKVVEQLETLGCKYRIDIASGSGFEYYTGIMFQLFNGDDKVGGGGRYNALIPSMGGGNIPASGFALYADRLMGRATPSELHATRITITFTDTERALKEAFSIAGRLREAGYLVVFDLDGKETPALGWVLSINDKYILNNRATHVRFEVSSAEEVVKLLGEEKWESG